MKRAFLALGIVLTCLGGFGGTGLGQTPAARVSGSVHDPSGARVPQAFVRAEHLATGRTLEVRTNSEGRYQFLLLPAGEYELAAEKADFAGVPRRVRLAVGDSLEVNLSLVLEAQRAAIEVVESTPLLEAGSPTVGGVILRESLAALPLNQREFLQLALLNPGALPAAPGSELARQNDSGLHLFGAREASNNFLLDGVDNNDLFINRLVVSPPLDSVREFRLHAANYRAEYGRSSGAQVNVVSRAGGNALHGSLYEYLRNESLDARNFFDPAGQPIPQFRRHQFGASLGGPIQRERSFFFGGYEGTRIRDAVTKTARVPREAEKRGDFSASPRPVIDPFTQRPFPNNRIPAERIDAIGSALAQNWPAANLPDPAQNLVSTPVGDGLINQGYGRFDHYFSASGAFYARYNFSHDRSLDPFNDGVTNVPGFGSFILNRAQNLAVSETHVFGPRAVWETRFGFNRLRREVLQQNHGFDIASDLGIPGLPRDEDLTGFPFINAAGFDSLGDNIALPIIRGDNTYHLLSHLSLVRGRHTLKMGGEYRRVSVDGLQALFARGQFNFLGALTTNPVADLLLGLPTFTIQTKIDNPLAQRASSWSAYAQDDWKLSPRLTLNLGLRYEWNRPAVDAADHFTVFDLERRELIPAGQRGISRAGYDSDNNNFAPRLGLSWSPTNSGNLVVRGGYGVFYDAAILEVNSGLYFNPPFFELSLFFPSEQNLLTLSDPFPGAGFTPPPSVNSLQPDFRTAYSQHWNASLEKALPGRLVARASYVGTKGTKLLRRRDVNQPPPGPGDVNGRRPIAGFANVAVFESGSSSTYHSGVFSLERRFRNRLGFSAAYTWSKSIDDMSAFLGTDGDQSFPQNSHNLAAERGLSSFDARHRTVFSASYETPFRHVLTRHWQIFAIGSFQSGRPFTPQLSFDNSNTGNTGSIFGADRPNVAGDPRTGPSTPERFFNTTAFQTPPPFTFGNAGRNVLIGPGLASLDVALVRSFHFREGWNLDFRAEAFNLANHANFDLPRRIADQPTFGRITSAGAARQLQMSLRFSF